MCLIAHCLQRLSVVYKLLQSTLTGSRESLKLTAGLARGPQGPSHPTLYVTHAGAPQPCQAIHDVLPHCQRNQIDVSWAPLCADDQDGHDTPAACPERDHLQIQ